MRTPTATRSFLLLVSWGTGPRPPTATTQRRTDTQVVLFGRGHVFDEYTYADSSTRHFYQRYRTGELDWSDAGWVNPSDFEPNFPDSLRSRRPD